MFVLITGGSGSGKSAYAEEYITGLSRNSAKYYIATMQVYDQEGEKKVEKHRLMRKDKGFFTIEQPIDVEKACEKMEDLGPALLECMSNLVANEMFTMEGVKSCSEVTDKIVQGVLELKEKVENLVIVTNNVFEDGICYDETTMEYIKTMGIINQKLTQMSDRAIEVVAGIPVVIKGEPA